MVICFAVIVQFNPINIAWMCHMSRPLEIFSYLTFAILTTLQSDAVFPGEMDCRTLAVFTLWKWFLISLFSSLILDTLSGVVACLLLLISLFLSFCPCLYTHFIKITYSVNNSPNFFTWLSLTVWYIIFLIV